MSGIADDWEAQADMLRQAHSKLSQLDPKHSLLSPYDTGEHTLNFRAVVDMLGIDKEYNNHPHPNLYAMAVYTEKLKHAIGERPRR